MLVQDLITGVENVDNWKLTSKAWDTSDGSEREAQSFIVRCVEAILRERQVFLFLPLQSKCQYL